VFAVLIFLLVAGILAAQDGIPSTPAVTFINASPTEISRPATARALAADLLNAIDPAGNVKQGLSLDFAPWSLIPGLRITLQDYQENTLKYMLANTQVSVATTKTSGSVNDTDFGFGVRVTFLDDSDFMKDRDFIAELDRRRQEECQAPEQPEDTDRYEECLGRVFVEAVENWQTQHQAWNRNAVSMAFATGLRLGDSELANAEWTGIGTWLTGALKLGSWGQLTGQAEYDFRRDSFGDVLSHILKASVRGLAGSPDFNASVEYSACFDFSELDGDWYSDRLTAAAEYRIGESIWLSTGIGLSIADPDERVSLLSSVRWEILSGPKLVPPAENGP
jgi:hypothetical protein